MNKNFFSNIDYIKNDKKISDSIYFQKLDIDKYEKEIEKSEKDIEKKHAYEISLIAKLREIKGDEQNHIDNIICNDLKDKQKSDYNKKKEELFNSLESNMEDGKKKREEILDLIKKIESSKEEIRKLEFSKTVNILGEVEKAKNNILIGFGNYIVDNEKNKKLIDILNEDINY